MQVAASNLSMSALNCSSMAIAFWCLSSASGSSAITSPSGAVPTRSANFSSSATRVSNSRGSAGVVSSIVISFNGVDDSFKA